MNFSRKIDTPFPNSMVMNAFAIMVSSNYIPSLLECIGTLKINSSIALLTGNFMFQSRRNI